MRKTLALIALAILCFTNGCQKPTVNPENPSVPKKWKVTTVAGSGTASLINGPASGAAFRFPEDVVVANDGNIVITDVLNGVLRRFAAGEVSTFAGSGDFGIVNGGATQARFRSPYSLAIDGNGNIYSSDDNDPRIRKITPNGEVSTFAGTDVSGFAEGNAANAQFRAGSYLVTNAAGDLIVSDGINNRIRKISGGQVSTVAGTGTGGFKEGNGTEAEFNFPGGIAIDRQGNIYVADRGNHRIRKISADGIVSTLAGSGTQGNKDGNPNEAQFTLDMRDLVVDQDGNLYLSDLDRIRKITPQGVVSTIAGSDAGFAEGEGTEAKFNYPNGMSINSRGDIFIADLNNNRIRKLSLE
jgi:sugar lactone lactonase YvrE